LLDIKVDGPLMSTENSKCHCRNQRLVCTIQHKLSTCCKYTCKQPRPESFRRQYIAWNNGIINGGFTHAYLCNSIADILEQVTRTALLINELPEACL